MTGKKLKYCVIHVTDTPAGRAVSAADIEQWHRGVRIEKDHVVFNGEKFAALSAIPPQLVGGISVYKTRGRGWRRVGYRDMITADGKVINLTPYNWDDVVDPWEITNGVAGINQEAWHVVVVGGRSADNKKTEDTRTKAQHEALNAYVLDLVRRFPGIQVSGHNQWDKNKQCPCYSVPQWAKSIGVPTKNIYPNWP